MRKRMREKERERERECLMLRQVSQPRNDGHLRLAGSLTWGVPGPVGLSTPRPLSHDNKTCLQTCPNVPCGEGASRPVSLPPALHPPRAPRSSPAGTSTCYPEGTVNEMKKGSCPVGGSPRRGGEHTAFSTRRSSQVIGEPPCPTCHWSSP